MKVEIRLENVCFLQGKSDRISRGVEIAGSAGLSCEPKAESDDEIVLEPQRRPEACDQSQMFSLTKHLSLAVMSSHSTPEVSQKRKKCCV